MNAYDKDVQQAKDIEAAWKAFDDAVIVAEAAWKAFEEDPRKG